MVHLSEIEARISKLGIKIGRFFRPELRELQHILVDNEKIVVIVCGRYFAGFAMLVATEQRLLLIDKKIPYLSVEDIRYDMISEIDYSNSLYSSTINIFTVNKQHRFTSIRHRLHLRKLAFYAQQRVMELRHYQQQLPKDVPQQSINPARPLNIPQARPLLSSQTTTHSIPAIQSESYKQPTHPLYPVNSARPDYLSKSVGSAAINASTPWVITNPYSKGSLSTRRQNSRLIPSNPNFSQETV